MSIDNVSRARLHDARRECSRHLRYLRSALSGLAPLLPLTGKRYEALSETEVKDLDQFIFRFTKLQDAIGVRLFSAVLDLLQEAYEGTSMLDKLNRLEKLGWLDDATEWETIRQLRNRLTHEYPDDPELNAETINLGVEGANRLELILAGVDDSLRNVGIEIDEGTS